MKPSNSNDRINLNRIPHPEEDDHLRSVGWVTDDDYTGVAVDENPHLYPIPYPTHQYVFKDTGNSCYRYMRPTMRVVPQSYYMLNKTKIPASVFVTPFADHVSVADRS